MPGGHGDPPAIPALEGRDWETGFMDTNLGCYVPSVPSTDCMATLSTCAVKGCPAEFRPSQGSAPVTNALGIFVTGAISQIYVLASSPSFSQQNLWESGPKMLTQHSGVNVPSPRP